MIESLPGLPGSDDKTTIRLAFGILNNQKLELSDKIGYLNASNYRVVIDPLNQFFDRPGNRLYIVTTAGLIRIF